MSLNRRQPELQGIIHDHQDILELSWKIRAGIDKDAAPARIQRYCSRFLKSRLKPHFQLEEQMLFPIVGMDHPTVRKALAGHRRLQRLIHGRGDPEVALSLVEEELEAQVRLEERELFGHILEEATHEQLMEVMQAHVALPETTLLDRPGDVFWK